MIGWSVGVYCVLRWVCHSQVFNKYLFKTHATGHNRGGSRCLRSWSASSNDHSGIFIPDTRREKPRVACRNDFQHFNKQNARTHLLAFFGVNVPIENNVVIQNAIDSRVWCETKDAASRRCVFTFRRACALVWNRLYSDQALLLSKTKGLQSCILTSYNGVSDSQGVARDSTELKILSWHSRPTPLDARLKFLLGILRRRLTFLYHLNAAPTNKHMRRFWGLVSFLCPQLWLTLGVRVEHCGDGQLAQAHSWPHRLRLEDSNFSSWGLILLGRELHVSFRTDHANWISPDSGSWAWFTPAKHLQKARRKQPVATGVFIHTQNQSIFKQLRPKSACASSAHVGVNWALWPNPGADCGVSVRVSCLHATENSDSNSELSLMCFEHLRLKPGSALGYLNL